LELELQQRLSSGDTPATIAAKLAERWFDPDTTDSEKRTMAFFLLNSQQYGHLLEAIARILREGRTLPWDVTVEVFGRISELPRDIREALFKGLAEENALLAAIGSFTWDQRDPDFELQRQTYWSSIEQKIAERKKYLLDKLSYVQAQRLLDDEAKILKELQALDPEDKEILTWQEEYEWRWAREVINRRSVASPPEAPAQTPRRDLEEDLILQIISKQVFKLIRKTPEMGMDLALMLLFFEDSKRSIDTLTKLPESPARNWLLLQLLTQQERFVEALDWVNRLLPSTHGNPEHQLSLLYFKAQSLHGLGQRIEAQDTLKQLLAVEPHYREAERLLAIWEGKL
jgi:hypothetical protein